MSFSFPPLTVAKPREVLEINLPAKENAEKRRVADKEQSAYINDMLAYMAQFQITKINSTPLGAMVKGPDGTWVKVSQ